jgi:hypothetical protein
VTDATEPGDDRETIDDQQERQAREGLEHPAPSSVEEPDDDPMDGPAPTG